MKDIEKAIALLRARPQAARLFVRPSVQDVLACGRRRGVTIHSG